MGHDATFSHTTFNSEILIPTPFYTYSSQTINIHALISSQNLTIRIIHSQHLPQGLPINPIIRLLQIYKINIHSSLLPDLIISQKISPFTDSDH